MSYNKKVWKSGDRITKEALNNMENGIYEAHQNSGGTGSVAIVDNLNSNSSTSALSAKQGKELNNKMPAKSIVEGGKIYLAKEDGTKLDSGTELPAGGSTIEVVNNLESDSTTAALSAAQGKALNTQYKDIAYQIDVKNNKNNLLLNDIQSQIDEAYRLGYNKVRFPFNKTIELIDNLNGVSDKVNYKPVLLKLHSNTIYDLNNCTIKIKPNNYIGYYLINFELLKNTILKNGTLVGDRYEHTYIEGQTSEYGTGILFSGCKNCVCENLEIKDFTGDGAYIGISLSYYSPAFNQSDMELGKIDIKTGENISDENSYRTAKYLDLDTFLSDDDKNIGLSLKNKLFLFPGNSWGYGSMNQFKTKEVYVIFYDSNHKFISTSYSLLAHPIDIPENSKYFKYYFPNKDMADFTNQTMMIRIGEVTESTFIQNCIIHDCRRQGVSISCCISSGVKDTIIHDIHGTEPQSCIDIEDGGHSTQNVKISNVIMKNSSRGLILYDGTDHMVTNCYIENCKFGISCNASIRCTVDKCTLVNSKYSFSTKEKELNGYIPNIMFVKNCNIINSDECSILGNIVAENLTILNPNRVDIKKGATLKDSYMLFQYKPSIGWTWSNATIDNCIIESKCGAFLPTALSNCTIKNTKFIDFLIQCNESNIFINDKNLLLSFSSNSDTKIYNCQLHNYVYYLKATNSTVYHENCTIDFDLKTPYGIFTIMPKSSYTFSKCMINNEISTFLFRNADYNTTDGYDYTKIIFTKSTINSKIQSTNLFGTYQDKFNLLIADSELTNITVPEDRPNYIDEDNTWEVK